MKNQFKKFINYIIIIVFFTFISSNCEFAGPGATGTVSVGSTVTAASYNSFCMVVFADPQNQFTSSKLNFITSSGFYTNPCLPTNSITFPYHYEIGPLLGQSDVSDWKVIAWFTNTSYSSIVTGDAYGFKPFKIKSCWKNIYCSKTENVNFTINTIAP